MTDNIVVPQSPTSPGVIVTDNDKSWGNSRGLEGKDATFIHSSQVAVSDQLLMRDVVDNKAFFERGLGVTREAIDRNHFTAAMLAKDNVIELLRTDAKRGEQLATMQATILGRLDTMEAKTSASALQDAKNEITLLKIKFGVIP